MSHQLRYVVFVRVGWRADQGDLFSIFDIIEPLPKFRGKLLRAARLSAAPSGYVLVGRADRDWDTYRKVAAA